MRAPHGAGPIHHLSEKTSQDFAKAEACARSYVGEADGAVPLHRFLDYIQTGVVPAGQLEPQGPVGGDDGVADELKTQW